MTETTEQPEQTTTPAAEVSQEAPAQQEGGSNNPISNDNSSSNEAPKGQDSGGETKFQNKDDYATRVGSVVGQLKSGGSDIPDGMTFRLLRIQDRANVSDERLKELAAMSFDDLDKQPEMAEFVKNRSEKTNQELKQQFTEVFKEATGEDGEKLNVEEGLKLITEGEAENNFNAAKGSNELSDEEAAELKKTIDASVQERVGFIASILEEMYSAGIFEIRMSDLIDLLTDPDRAYGGSFAGSIGNRWENEGDETTFSLNKWQEKLKSDPKKFAESLRKSFKEGSDALEKQGFGKLKFTNSELELLENVDKKNLEPLKQFLNLLVDRLFEESDPVEVWGKVRTKWGREIQEKEDGLPLSIKVLDYLRLQKALNTERRWSGMNLETEQNQQTSPGQPIQGGAAQAMAA